MVISSKMSAIDLLSALRAAQMVRRGNGNPYDPINERAMMRMMGFEVRVEPTALPALFTIVFCQALQRG